MSGTEEEVGGEPVDEIAKIAGPIGGPVSYTHLTLPTICSV